LRLGTKELAESGIQSIKKVQMFRFKKKSK